jgi:hypothetical protein
MDYHKIKEFIAAQRSRDPRPLKSFENSLLAVIKTCEEMDSTELEAQSKALLTNLMITYLVTIIECYFRDSLDAIFRVCKHTAYLPALNKLLKQKYTAQEIIELEAEGLHFLQVIPRELSFQSLDQISGAYNNFIDGFVKEIMKRQFRFASHQLKVMQVTDKTLSVMSELFSLRHSIVHNPNNKTLRDTIPDIDTYIEVVWDFVFCANITIEEFMGNNLKKSVKVKRRGEVAK